MKYILYKGNPRKDREATKITEFTVLNDALNRLAIERNNGIDAYLKEEGGEPHGQRTGILAKVYPGI